MGNDPPTLTKHLGRMKALVERIRASAAQAEASADNLAGAPKCGSDGATNVHDPAGLIDQMGKVLDAAEASINRLGHALDRIDRAHG